MRRVHRLRIAAPEDIRPRHTQRRVRVRMARGIEDAKTHGQQTPKHLEVTIKGNERSAYVAKVFKVKAVEYLRNFALRDLRNIYFSFQSDS